MDDNNRQEFYGAWSTMIEMQAGKELSDRALRLAFDLLKDYDLSEIKQALRAHCLKSVFIAKPADIVLIIHGELPSNTELYGLAQSNDTILGTHVHSIVGAHDVKHLAARDATARVSSQRRAISDFVTRIQAGMMTDAEIMLYGGRGYDVTAWLCPGLPGARLVYHDRLRARQEDLCKPQITASVDTSEGPETSAPMSEKVRQAARAEVAQCLDLLRTPVSQAS